MTTLNAPNAQVYSPSLPSLAAIERRRRPLTIVFGISVACVLLMAESHWQSHGLIREILFLIGITLAAIGTLGRTWSNFYISGYKSSHLVQSGPYSICRNPLYFFSSIGMIGIGLCTGMLAVPAAMALFFAVYYPAIINCEESRLLIHHRDDFEEYCRATPVFWPRFCSYREPDTYTVFPRMMRKYIADAFWFIALAALARIVAVLHEVNALPAYVQLF